MHRHLYPNSMLEVKTKFQQKVAETKRNIAEEMSFALARRKIKYRLLFNILTLFLRGWGLLQNLTAKGGGLLERGA